MKNNYERLLAFMQNNLQVEKDSIEAEVRYHVGNEAPTTTDFIDGFVDDNMKFYFNGIVMASASGLITCEESVKLLDEFYVCFNRLKRHAYRAYYDERRKKRQAHSRRHSICVECYAKLKDKDIDLDSH